MPPAKPASGFAALPAMNDARHERYAQAAVAFAAIPDVRSVPSFAAGLVGALRLAGRTDEALAEAAALAARFPQDCDAAAMLAALRLERREAAAAHRLADRPLAAAAQESAMPAEIRCGLRAAAALQDPAAAAALLDRIARSEPALRTFARGVLGQTGTMWIDQRTYPWSLIARQPAVAEARERLDAAYAREREIARAELKGLP